MLKWISHQNDIILPIHTLTHFIIMTDEIEYQDESGYQKAK